MDAFQSFSSLWGAAHRTRLESVWRSDVAISEISPYGRNDAKI